MNFFKLYIGDYQRDTGHLSVAEHGAYLLMLQHYYATEKPLPTGKSLHRLLRAASKAERSAIDSVAAQFWEEVDGGLVNRRAAREFDKAQEIAETNQAIAVAREARRREKRERENSTNRAPDVPETEHEPCTNRAQSVARKEHEQSTYQTPDTRHQTDNPTLGESPGAVCARLRSEASMVHTNPSDPRLIAALADGVTGDELVSVAKEFPHKPLAYVVKTAQGRRTDALSTSAGAPDGSSAAGNVRNLSAVARIDRAAADAGIDLSESATRHIRF